jgi:FAD/FMN-containing dehydrogenase
MSWQASLSDFCKSIRGQLLLPSDKGYNEARQIHNAMIDRRPAAIVRCASVADVMAAVQFARKHNVLVSIRGAGHNVAGTSLCDDGIVIDLSAMKSIHVNPVLRTVRVEPGVTWAELSRELQPFALAATGGFVGTTGVSGLTLGGGLGWMVRRHGLALDNLLSVDVVTAEGVPLTASADENADLFWGMRGAGANFGVATSFVFKVHPAGTVLAGMALHPTSHGREAMRFFREFERNCPTEYTNNVVMFRPPAELPVPEVLHREGAIGIGGVYVGDLSQGERVLRPMREFGPPAADIFRRMPYSEAQTMADFLWPRGSHNYWKSSYLTGLPDEAIDTILRFFENAPSRLTTVVLEHDGDGAVDRVHPEETAFRHRNWPYNFLITTIWKDPAEAEQNIRWTREFWDAMRTYRADAAYVNYLGEVGDDLVRLAYGANYERLVALKDKYDPTNFFRVNMNIRPSRTRMQATA